MSQYATASELASFLEQDVDTATANLALTIASGLFNTASGTRFESTAATWTAEALGYWRVYLPLTPVLTVTAVRINGVAITDYIRINDRLYRRGGFGVVGVFPPDKIDVDYTYGYAAVPDDVKGAVLETAAAAYSSPDITTVSERIDDYEIRSAANAGGFSLSPAAAALARSYAAAAPLVA